MKWIKINFQGGLGNQLFQYATARALAIPGGRLLFDTQSYEADYLNRRFGLGHFKVTGKVISDRYLKKVFTPGTTLNKVVSSFGSFEFIQEDGLYFHNSLSDRLAIFTAIKGYWQAEQYFGHIRTLLLNEIVPKYLPERPSFLGQANTVAIHVRRADYLDDSAYGFVGEKYYREALQRLKSRLREPLFIWFSDDMAWCREHFSENDCLFADERSWSDDYLQLYLFSQCKHQIIANSSFSWWGAWLNQNEGRIVIRPEKPFRDASLLYDGHYPANWIAL